MSDNAVAQLTSLDLNSIPLLKGVEDIVLKGFKSSLYSQNRKPLGERNNRMLLHSKHG
jgi:hypothetical protein